MNLQKIIVSGILVSDNSVLITKRPMTKKIAPGKCHLPGGHVEFDETPEDALKREFMEEFSLSVDILDIVRSFSYVNDNCHTVGITYLVKCINLPKNINFNSEDNEEIFWVNDVTFKNYFPEEDHDYITLKKYFLTKK